MKIFKSKASESRATAIDTKYRGFAFIINLFFVAKSTFSKKERKKFSRIFKQPMVRHHFKSSAL